MPQVCRAPLTIERSATGGACFGAPISAPQQAGAPSPARTAQENCAPAETAENSPAGGSSIHAAPQQASEPSARTPQLCEAPAATAPNSPAGGVLMP